MMTKLIAAMLALVALGAASTAAAQDGRRGGGEWRRQEPIVVRTPTDSPRVVMPGEREHRQLTRRTHTRQQGLTYVYTDICNRSGCVVYVFNGGAFPIDRIIAPPPRS